MAQPACLAVTGGGAVSTQISKLKARGGEQAPAASAFATTTSLKPTAYSARAAFIISNDVESASKCWIETDVISALQTLRFNMLHPGNVISKFQLHSHG